MVFIYNRVFRDAPLAGSRSTAKKHFTMVADTVKWTERLKNSSRLTGAFDAKGANFVTQTTYPRGDQVMSGV